MHLSVPCHGVPGGMLQGVQCIPQRSRNMHQTQQPFWGTSALIQKPFQITIRTATTPLQSTRGWVAQYPEGKTIAMCEQRSTSAALSRVFFETKQSLYWIFF